MLYQKGTSFVLCDIFLCDSLVSVAQQETIFSVFWLTRNPNVTRQKPLKKKTQIHAEYALMLQQYPKYVVAWG